MKDTPHPCCLAGVRPAAHPGHVELRALDFSYFLVPTSYFVLPRPVLRFRARKIAKRPTLQISPRSRRVGAVGALQLKAEQQREASNEGAHMASPLSDYKPLETFRAITLGSVLHPWLY